MKAGEVLGVSGLMGAGRTEIMQSIFGNLPETADMQLLNPFRDQLLFLLAVNHMILRDNRKIRKRNIFLDTFLQHQPFHFPILRNESREADDRTGDRGEVS